VLTDPQPVNTIRNLAVSARMLDAWSEVGVPQRDAVLVAARGIANLSRRDGTVRVDPVALPPPRSGRGIADLLAVAVLFCWCELSH
jgi:hypothetical protein